MGILDRVRESIEECRSSNVYSTCNRLILQIHINFSLESSILKRKRDETYYNAQRQLVPIITTTTDLPPQDERQRMYTEMVAALSSSNTLLGSTSRTAATLTTGPETGIRDRGDMAADIEQMKSTLTDTIRKLEELKQEDVSNLEKYMREGNDRDSADVTRKRIALQAEIDRLVDMYNNPQLLRAYRADTFKEMLIQIRNVPENTLNNQVSKDRLKNFIVFLLNKYGSKAMNLIIALISIGGFTITEFISLIPATISALVLAQILSGISWMGAPIGTQLALLPANMSFTQSFLSVLTGNAQNIAYYLLHSIIHYLRH